MKGGNERKQEDETILMPEESYQYIKVVLFYAHKNVNNGVAKDVFIYLKGFIIKEPPVYFKVISIKF